MNITVTLIGQSIAILRIRIVYDEVCMATD